MASDEQKKQKRTAGQAAAAGDGNPSAGASSPPRKKKINPVTASADELIARLGSDGKNGLAPKEAARRLARDGGGGLFLTQRPTVKECLRRLSREPILWMFLAVCVIALFFDRVWIGLLCAILALSHSALVLLALRRAGQIDAAMQAYDCPLARVVRGGTVRRVSSDSLCKGDVLLLSPGDVVSADARLLSVEGELTVTERALDGDEAHRRTLRLTKHANALTAQSAHTMHSPENMVWAGGVVESGSARALVVAAGKNTHLAGLCGGLTPSHPGRDPKAFRRAERYLNLWSLILAVAVIPLVFIGYFTLRASNDLLELVLAALSLSVISLAGRWLALGSYAGASLRHAAAAARDPEDRVNVKTFACLDPLSRMDEFVIVGTAALHDGILHPDALTLGCPDGVDPADGSLPLVDTYDCTRPESDELSAAFCEGMYLFGRGLQARVSENGGAADGETASLLELIGTLTAWSELDTSALMARVSELTVHASTEPGTAPTVSVAYTSGRRVSFRISYDPAEIGNCTLIAGKRYHTIHEGEREVLRTAARRSELSGSRVLLLLSVRDAQPCLEGILTCGPHVCRRTVSTIRALENAGVRVTAFLRTVSYENTRVLSACGLTDSAAADRPERGRPRRPAVEISDAGVRAFEGCRTSYVADYVSTRRAEGFVVGVLSGDRRDLTLISAADVAFTTAPDMYDAAFTGTAQLRAGEGVTPDGTPDGAVATDLMRRRADVIVRRSGTSGGGILGVYHALRTSERLRRGFRSALRYLLISHLARLLFVLISLCAGLTLIGAPFVLLSGLGLDLLAVFVLIHADDPRAKADAALPADRRGLFAFLLRPWETYLPELIAASLAGITPWIAAGIASALAVPFGADLQPYAFLSLWVIQFAAFMTDRPSWGRSRWGLWTVVAFLCFLAGGLAVALSSGLRLLWILVFPILPGLVFIAVWLISRRVVNLRKKAGK